MPDRFDLDAYFRRIGFAGPARADAATLNALHRLHVRAIPFENIDALMGLPVTLDQSALQEKLVRGRRGGYCFEQNTLFAAALRTVGFAVSGLAACVRRAGSPDRPLRRLSHMLLRVDLSDGPWVADVGFGSNLLDAPLRFACGVEQETPAGRYVLREHLGAVGILTRTPSNWRWLYAFDLNTCHSSDYERANAFTATAPHMWSTTSLLIERLTEDARYILSGTQLVVQSRGGGVTKQRIAGAGELGAVLNGVFGLAVPVPVDRIYRKIAVRPT
ncbi:arylamine N-acetyltransferase family protein [Microvirga calopogonii]|uniref:arylamine N-acetyltransferase family protein n=1 Tax=Microvirga calopogonii TaxID=2078013 RepID=UPI000E0DD9A7|nr:arylamine N-acetyltransferase [Microvirga calopogonii]